MIEEIQALTPVIISSIVIIGGVAFYRIRTRLNIEKMKNVNRVKKQQDTFEGSIEKMIESAPDNLNQINSEIETLKAKGATPEMLKRLESEKNMLEYAVKYGDIAKPLLKPVSGIIEKVLGGIGK